MIFSFTAGVGELVWRKSEINQTFAKKLQPVKYSRVLCAFHCNGHFIFECHCHSLLLSQNNHTDSNSEFVVTPLVKPKEMDPKNMHPCFPQLNASGFMENCIAQH